MKARKLIRSKRRSAAWLEVVVTALMAAGLPVLAEDTAAEAEAPEPLTPEQMFEGGENTYANWIEFSAGGVWTGGNTAQAQQSLRVPQDPFGGIEDFHYQRDLGKDTLLKLDGRALFNTQDYGVNLDLAKPDLGYLKFKFDQYRIWSNGTGGYYPATDTWYSLGDDPLALDRGEISVEAGLTLDKIPKISFLYQHLYRDGEKASTIWGLAQPDLNLTRGLNASVQDIDDARDIFQLDVAHTIKSVDFGLGVRYETGDLDTTLNATQFPGQAQQQQITHREGASYDFFNANAFVETWMRKNVFFSSALAYNKVDNDFSGGRSYVPGTTPALGYLNLNGGSRMDEYLWNLNLMWNPWRQLSIVPSLRVQYEDMDADSSGTGTLGAGTTPFTSVSERDSLDVRERLDLRYTGITNWVFHARGEWTEGDGTLTEEGGLTQVAAIGPPPIARETDDTRFFQKYTAGINWYPLRKLSLDAEYYYKDHNYDYSHPQDSTANGSASGNRYPAYLVNQQITTHDGSLRLRYRPLNTVTLVTSYELQWSEIYTEPDAASGLGGEDSATTTAHIFGQTASWIPWSRLSLQGSFNYVLSETKSPANDASAALPKSENDYWVLGLSSGFVLTDKTDLTLAYAWVHTDNYEDISPYIGYGAGGDQHSITAGVVHRLRENIRLNLRYGYFVNDDKTYGGNNDYTAHLVYGGIQYRF
jgi:hypothetical protein